MHSSSSFGSDFIVAIFTDLSTLLQTSRIMTELCYCNFVVWACNKMGGGGLSPAGFQSGGLNPPPISSPLYIIIVLKQCLERAWRAERGIYSSIIIIY